jgi:hypothetical protein
VVAGAQRLITEETVGTSGGPDELLLTGSGSQEAVATDLTDDLLLTDDNVDILKKAHDLTMVKPESVFGQWLSRVANLALSFLCRVWSPAPGSRWRS